MGGRSGQSGDRGGGKSDDSLVVVSESTGSLAVGGRGLDSNSASCGEVILLSLESSEGDEAAHHSVNLVGGCSTTNIVGV